MRLGARALGFGLADARAPSFRVSLALAAAFLVLAGLVTAGALGALDQFAVDHLMPTLRAPRRPSGSILTGLYRPFTAGTVWWCALLDLWTYPCSVLISALIVARVLRVGARRGERRLQALAIAAAWGLGNLVELVGKGVLRRPDLYVGSGALRTHVSPFDASFPSGHMIRGTVVLAALAFLWPRRRLLFVLWLALVGPFLVLSASHTPSDVLGGLLVGLALIAPLGSLGAHPSPRPVSAVRLRVLRGRPSR